MKVRQGFVSNSSSSSFIIKVAPEDVIYEGILDKVESFPNIGFKSEQYARTIYRDAQKEMAPKSESDEDFDIVSPKNAFSLFDDLSYDDVWVTFVDQISHALSNDEYELFVEKWGMKILDARAQCVEEMKNILSSDSNLKIIKLEYGDDDGEYFSFLEHSGIIEHVFPDTKRISNH